MKTKWIFYLLIYFLIGITANGQGTESIETGMVLIPEGEFMMGKNSDSGSDFSPAHKVNVDAFLMDKHEVTNGEYLKFCLETSHKFPEFWNSNNFKSGEAYLTYPVIGISWADANKYAKWAGKRLPTEAEWEYAARGGLIDKDYPNGNRWIKVRAKQEPGSWKNLVDPVGKFESNGFGLYDMGGNVWEWVSDKYSLDYYKVYETDNPSGPGEGENRIIRGGSWHSGPMCKKVYYRKGMPGNWCDFAIGFRCVKDIEK